MENFILKSKKSIAVMGGTFDPIHNGHLAVAKEVKRKLGVEAVLFIPTGRPPHKETTNITPGRHRFQMTSIAINGYENFFASSMEIERLGLTYTINTISALKKLCRADCEIFFITGADAILEIFSWKDSEKLLSMCSFVAVTRPGFDELSLQRQVEILKKDYNVKLHFLDTLNIDISSTTIRSKIRLGESVEDFVPPFVNQYITKHGLYRDTENDFLASIYRRLKRDLTAKRYKHTLGVTEEAVKLAEFYASDKDRAFLAALLHDIAKDIPNPKKLSMCKEYNIPLDDILTAQPELTHSFISAEIAYYDFGIQDKLTLDAVRFHTTGRANMTLLDKIIFVADAIEPGRDNYEGLEEIRHFAYKDLDLAVLTTIEATISDNKKKKRAIHVLSIEALEFLKNTIALKDKYI